MFHTELNFVVIGTVLSYETFQNFEVQKDQDARICPFVNLKEYVDRTSSLRQNAIQLFNPYVKPYKPMSSNTSK